MTAMLTHIAATLVARAPESDDSVEAGRNALSQWGRYPWYDAKSDGLQPIDIVEPYDWNGLFSWLNFNWTPFGFLENWSQVVSGLIILVVLGLLAWFLIRAYRNRRRGAETIVEMQGESPEEEHRRIEALPEPARQRTRLLEEALRHYTEGNYDEAVIYLFSHQLVYLDKNHLIRLTRGKTNRQYLRELGPRDGLKRLLADTVVAFEDVFFGGRSIGREQFERCWNGLNEFETLATGGAVR